MSHNRPAQPAPPSRPQEHRGNGLVALLSFASSPLPSLGAAAILVVVHTWLSFKTEEPLFELVRLLHHNLPLQLVLWLFPANLLARLASGLSPSLESPYRRMPGVASYREELPLDPDVEPARAVPLLRRFGYRVRFDEETLRAARGVPTRGLIATRRLGLALALAGLALSLETRSSLRVPLIEGEPLPPQLGPGRVRTIRLIEDSGILLEKSLGIEVERGGATETLRLFPPTRIGTRYVYPRYLGLGIRLAVLSEGSLIDRRNYLLSVYPPGRRDEIEIPGTPYSLGIQLLQDPLGDPYATGRFRLLLDSDRAGKRVGGAECSLPGGFGSGGLLFRIEAAHRYVIADIVSDHGVPLIFAGLPLFLLALLFSAGIARLFPRREIRFDRQDSVWRGTLRTETRRREVHSVFYECLDLLQNRPSGSRPDPMQSGRDVHV